MAIFAKLNLKLYSLVKANCSKLCFRGYKRFFKRTSLETSDYLKDDCLSVNCSVGVVKSHTEGPRTFSIAISPSNIGHQFGKLLESGKGSDVSFEVDGETYVAHKLVLAARTAVFRAQLFGPMKDQNTRCIKVEDMEAPVFKVYINFLRFLFILFNLYLQYVRNGCCKICSIILFVYVLI